VEIAKCLAASTVLCTNKIRVGGATVHSPATECHLSYRSTAISLPPTIYLSNNAYTVHVREILQTWRKAVVARGHNKTMRVHTKDYNTAKRKC